MPWFKLDDGITWHPKVIALGETEAERNEAFGAWARLGAYCSRYLTDGKVPAGVVKSICAGVEIRLVAAGWLERAQDGTFSMHDYLDYNPCAEKVKAERAATAERQSRWRQNNGRSNGVTNAAPDPIPIPIRSHTQPIPNQLDGWLAQVMSGYPRKATTAQSKARAATALAQLSDDDRQAFTKAVTAYARLVVVEKTEPRYVTTWPVFCEGKWRAFVPAEKRAAKAPSVYELSAEPPPPKEPA